MKDTSKIVKNLVLLVLIVIIGILTTSCKRKGPEYWEYGVTEPENKFDQLDDDEQVQTLMLALENDEELGIKVAYIDNIKETSWALDLEDEDIYSDSEEYLNHYKYIAETSLLLDNRQDDKMQDVQVWITPKGEYITDLFIVKNQEIITGIFEQKLDLLYSDFSYRIETVTKINKPYEEANKASVFNGNTDALLDALENYEADTEVKIVVDIENKEKAWDWIDEWVSEINFTSGEIKVYYNEDKNISSLFDIDLYETEMSYDTHLFVKGLSN